MRLRARAILILSVALNACGSGDSPQSPTSVASIEITAGSFVELEAGSTQQLTAIARDDNGNALSGREITWTSLTNSVAAVSSTGMVTAVAQGSATIRAASGGKSATTMVLVFSEPLGSITLSTTHAGLIRSETLQMTATPRDLSGAPVAGRVVTWSSSSPAVATVTSSGVVTALTAGSTIITARVGGENALATITVTDGGFIGANGSTISNVTGALTIAAPAGAVSTTTAVSFTSPATPPAHERLLAGSAFTIGLPAGEFAQPVTLRIRYDSPLPAAMTPELLAIHRWNGTAWIPLADASIDVANRIVSGTTTSAGTFAIIAYNPAPVITELSPSFRTARGVSFSLAVTGSGFVPGSIIRWNGSARPTAFGSSTVLIATIPASDVAEVGTAEVTVFTPAPIGGLSTARVFSILTPAPCTTVCFVASNGNDANFGTSQQDPLRTLAKALEQVSPAGMISLGLGAFEPATITKSVRLVGSQDAAVPTTIPVPEGGTGLTVSGTGITVRIEHIRFAATVSGSGTGVVIAPGSSGTVSVVNSVFSYPLFPWMGTDPSITSLFRGIDATQGTANLALAGNVFDRIGSLAGAPGSAIAIGSQGAGNIATITGNRIDGIGLRSGIILDGATGGSQLEANVITGVSAGVIGILVNSTFSGAATTITRNSITGHSAGGLHMLSNQTINATCNWWGGAGGPFVAPANTITGPGAVNVQFSPFLKTATSIATAPCTP